MKIKIKKITFLRIGKIVALATALIVLSACASISSLFQQTKSSLPVETIHASTGQIASARAFESGDKLYVAGSIRRSFGYALHRTVHVDIQLIGNHDQIISQKKDEITMADFGSRIRNGPRRRLYSSYVASFPLTEARQATKIRVTYHTAVHLKIN